MHPLTQARERLNLTQQQLADFIPVSLSTIQRAEAAQRISLYSRRKICEFFSEKYHRCIEPSELGLVYEKGRDKNNVLCMAKEGILVKDTGGEDAMKRQDLFRRLAAASFTTVAIPHEIPELLPSMDLISMVIARHPNATRKMLIEAEALTTRYCQYHPFIANVVDDSSLIFICGHLQMLLSQQSQR
jgi:DNA-binding XRE family transcriptional regulator